MELRGRNIDDIVFFGILYIIATFLAVVDCVIHVIAYTDKDTFQVNQSGERITGHEEAALRGQQTCLTDIHTFTSGRFCKPGISKFYKTAGKGRDYIQIKCRKFEFVVIFKQNKKFFLI